MPTPVEIGFEANGEQSVKRAWETVAKGCEDAIRSLAKLTPESLKADEAQRKLGASTEKWLKAISTPLQDYLGDLEELQKLLAAGTLNQDQYNAAVDVAKKRLEAQNTEVDKLAIKADALRASLITPQQKYQQELAESNELLAAGKITQEEYAAAVERSKQNLDAQDKALQDNLRDAARVKSQAVTPQEAYAAAIKKADELLKKKLITSKEYNAEVKRQEELLRKAEAGERSFLQTALSNTGEVLATITGVGSVIAGVAAVVSQLRAEYDNLVDRQKTAADRQIDTAQAQHSAIAALGDDKEINADQLTDRALKSSLDTGVLPKVIFDAQASALSSRAALSSKEALDAVDVAATANPYSGIAESAGSLLDLKNRFGDGALKDLNMRQLMGISLGGQQASRVKDSAAYATNAIPAITQLGAFKDNIQDSTALVAAFSTSMNDLTGATSGTAAIKLAKQLEIALPKLANTMERIAFVQSPAGDALRKKFFSPGPGKMDIEAGAYKSVQELLSPGENKTKANLAAARQAVPSAANAEQVFETVTRNQRSQKIQQLAAQDRQYKVEAEAAALADAAGAASAVNREGLIKFLKQMKATDVEQKLILTQFEAATQLGAQDPLDFATKKLREKQQYEAGDKYVQVYDEYSTETSGFRSATPEELVRSSQFGGAADRLERLQRARQGGLPAQAPAPQPDGKGEMRELTEALKENTAATKKNNEKPPVVIKRDHAKPAKEVASTALQKGGR